MHLLVRPSQSVLRSLLLIFLVCGYVQSYSQSEPIKFGKVEMKDLEMTAYPKDTSASAVVLGDYGKSYFVLTNYAGLQLIFERHTRIKILKKSGYEWANGIIPFYRESNSSEERIGKIKGFTYNLEKGQIIKSPLEKESIFEEKVTGYWYQKKISMPNVKEGSVVEFSYTITSDFLFNLRSWTFQKSIPVLWSEYQATIPDCLEYKQTAQGYEPFTVAESKSLGQPMTVGVGSDMKNICNSSNYYRWAIQDAPALREEPYITTMDDYVAKIEFELSSVQVIGQIPKSYKQTWAELNADLLERDDFGQQLKRVSFLKDELVGIKAKYTEPLERMQAVCQFVKKTMKWNEIEDKYAESTLKKAFENRSGNSADINLLLVAMLKEVGLNANPVILSTRDNGRAPMIPLITKFNYVIAHVSLNDKTWLLDATDRHASFDVLPLNCLNGVGRLIGLDSREIELHNNEKFVSYSNAKLTLNAEGLLSGTIEETHGGYNGLSLRKEIIKEGKDKYVEALKKERLGWEMENYDFNNLDKTGESLQSTCKVTIGENAQTAANLIYLNPMLHQKEETNPFKLENRRFPVDFAAPQEQTYILNLTIPADYQAEELPKPTLVSLPEGAGRFSYNAVANGNTIQVISKVTIKKVVFAAEEYELLKEFYKYIVGKHAEQIVLKKKSS